MPSRKTTKAALEAEARMPTIPKEIIDQFVTGPMTATAVNDLSMALRKALIERGLNAELSHHLGYQPGADGPWTAADRHPTGQGWFVRADPDSEACTALYRFRRQDHRRVITGYGIHGA
jgi:putative transposase